MILSLFDYRCLINIKWQTLSSIWLLSEVGISIWDVTILSASLKPKVAYTCLCFALSWITHTESCLGNFCLFFYQAPLARDCILRQSHTKSKPKLKFYYLQSPYFLNNLGEQRDSLVVWGPYATYLLCI